LAAFRIWDSKVERSAVRLAFLVAQQPNHDLLLVPLFVPIVAPVGQLVMLALKVAGSDVVEKQLRGPALGKQTVLNRFLTF